MTYDLLFWVIPPLFLVQDKKYLRPFLLILYPFMNTSRILLDMPLDLRKADFEIRFPTALNITACCFGGELSYLAL